MIQPLRFTPCKQVQARMMPVHNMVLAAVAQVQARLPAAQGAGGCGAGDLAKQCLIATIVTMAHELLLWSLKEQTTLARFFQAS